MAEIVCFEYRDTLKTRARTQTIFLRVRGRKVERIEPLEERRSKTGAHGQDCYARTQLADADVTVHVDISNSSKHYCSVTGRRLTREEAHALAQWLRENEHICTEILRGLGRLSAHPTQNTPQ